MIRYTVNNRNDLVNMPWYMTSLTVTSNTCNEVVVNKCELSPFKLLRSVVIGDSCFKYVPELILNELNWLESVRIGSSSFCFYCNGNVENRYREFQLTNCASLRELTIDRYSFSDYHIFELNNLPNLKSITIGSSSTSYNFYYVENVEFSSLPSLETLELGSSSFYYCHDIIFESINDMILLDSRSC